MKRVARGAVGSFFGQAATQILPLDECHMRSHPKTRERYELSLNVEKHEGTNRLDAFSDGLFGIAATLLVIGIKTPPGQADTAQLVDALIRQWPAYLSYVASFIVTIQALRGGQNRISVEGAAQHF